MGEKFERADTALGGGTKPHTKVVGDSFTMPEEDYEMISMLKDRCLNERVVATKAMILRTALGVLGRLSERELADEVRAVEAPKPGRRKAP
jgi:hypothetical protein